MIANGLLAIIQRRVLKDGLLQLRARNWIIYLFSTPSQAYANVLLRSGLDEAVLRNHGGAG